MELRTREDVDAALQLFPTTGTMSEGMVQLYMNLHIQNAQGNPSQPMLRAVQRVVGSFWTLLTILERHEWQKQQNNAGVLDLVSWTLFAGCDVEHFYIVLRSLFDDLAFLCSTMAVKKGTCPDTFNKLFQWSQQEKRADRVLGKELASAIRACTWFEEVRLTRDGIVHYGAHTMVMPSPHTTSFHVQAGANSSKVRPELMTNQQVADFELFMAWVIGNLALTLDQVGRIGLAALNVQAPVQVTSSRRAFRIVREYLVRLREKLPAVNPRNV